MSTQNKPDNGVKQKALAARSAARTKAAPPSPAVASSGIVRTYKPKAGGYLIDNKGKTHEISQWAAKALLAGVKPTATTGDEKLPMWKTDEGGDRFTTSTTYAHVNSCVYDAVKTAMQSLGVGTLTPGDKSFFTKHPRVTTDGVNKANVLAVAHGLAVPWGVGIIRVFMPKMSSLGEQQKEFASALGMNPMALQNYSTTNDEFIEAMEFDEEQGAMVRNMFRFEFVDEPRRPCVIMMSSTAKTKKTGGTTVKGAWSSTSSGIGHADFIGPRDSVSSNWKIAFQLGPLQEYALVDGKSINRYGNIEDAFDEAEIAAAPLANMQFSVWNSLIGGKTVNAWDSLTRTTTPTKVITPTTEKKATDKSVIAATPTSGSQPKVVTQPCPSCGGMLALLDGVQYCLACDWYEDFAETKAGVFEVCPICYGSLDKDGTCENDECKYNKYKIIESAFFICEKHNMPLLFVPRDEKEGGYRYLCPDCMFAEGTLLQAYISEDRDHPPELTLQIKEFKREEK